ncbi:MAG TPA: hypothetical protein VEC99_09740 [Clostridia bacterium]|nr:hypothetical protein [Clostridia bacterium]
MGNLIILERAKAQWQRDHQGAKEWPTKQDLLPYLCTDPQRTSFEQVILAKWGEIYILNRIGAPVYAYFPKAVPAWASEGQLMSVSTNQLNRFDAQ